jgi:AraC family transcriptional regulator of adaptative response/methylated-DNA-[protein]-cysteine methyltransferase
MPETRKRHADARTVRYATAASPLGLLFLAATDRGVCCLFLGGTEKELKDEFLSRLPGAELRPDTAGLRPWLAEVQEYLEGRRTSPDVPLDVRGTPFQRRVWEALRRIPYGRTRTYREVARAVGAPAAVRAVGGACAANPVALVIPCHRVVRSDGGLGGFAGGIGFKERLLALEKGD